jgi:hypothetical protein
MEKIPTQQLLNELKEIDSRVELVLNPNRPGLSNFKINGMDLCPVPSEYLQLEHSGDYVYNFPNGMAAPFKTYGEAKGLCEFYLNKLKDPEYSKEFFQRDDK